MLVPVVFLAVIFTNDASGKSSEQALPPIEIGMIAGRDGVAFGPGIVLQGNLQRLSLYGLAGTSSISGYSTSDGVRASLRDRTLGFGLQFQIVGIGKHFAIGGFGQAAYYGSHVNAPYFDPNHTMRVEYRASNRDPLVTIGPEIDYKIAKGVRLAIRPGKQFGETFAAQTVGGFSINVGVLVDAQSTATGIARGFKKLLR